MPNKFDFKGTKLFYDFLRGECTVDMSSSHPLDLPDFKIWTVESHLPKLTEQQAHLILYILQESYKVIPNNFKVCHSCGELFDSTLEGNCCEDESYCDKCSSETPNEKGNIEEYMQRCLKERVEEIAVNLLKKGIGVAATSSYCNLKFEDVKRLWDELLASAEHMPDEKELHLLKSLATLKKRPKLYLGENVNYSNLNSLICGYTMATLRDSNVAYSNILSDIRLEYEQTIANQTYSDEQLFYIFFEVFDEVLKRDYPDIESQL